MSTKPSDASLLSKIAGYTEILAKDSKSTVFVPLAECYRKMGMLDEALEVASLGTRAMPRFSPGFTALGRIQAQRQDLSAALGAFEKALEIDGDSLVALKSMARVLVQLGRKSRARELLERAVSLDPGDENALKMLQALGGPVSPDPEKKQQSPASPAPPAKFRPVPPRRGHESEDEQGLETVDPITTATIADIYIKQGFPRRAMKVYRDLLKADPHNADIRARLVALKRQLDAEDSAMESAGESSTVLEGENLEPIPGPVASGREENIAMAEVPAVDPGPEIASSLGAFAPGSEQPEPAANAEGLIAARIAALQGWLNAIAMRRAHV
ncbi:hypothetical protein DESUT3_17550 [Desulfuromonas versatilis]|uniref:Tetratricopeptide repeat protein n=1 Tax=Desulfuromonas versatilis TaxID=2802975 RepID=A0ABM8HVV4_9BACT|nr:tetratricopeptide repeat protein [Desulfuromonas versatilis]BCR04686.1 hypothetical protein DESUT3_17550 [Desulfuromonas versatilis]